MVRTFTFHSMTSHCILTYTHAGTPTHTHTHLSYSPRALEEVRCDICAPKVECSFVCVNVHVFTLCWPVRCTLICQTSALACTTSLVSYASNAHLHTCISISYIYIYCSLIGPSLSHMIAASSQAHLCCTAHLHHT